MKTLTKFTCSVFAVVTLAMGALTANGTPRPTPTPRPRPVALINGPLAASVDQLPPHTMGAVYEYPRCGVRIIFAELSFPRGVAFDSARNLFVAISDCSQPGVGCIPGIVKIAPNGTQSSFATLSPDFFAHGLAIDQSDNVFIVANDNSDPNLASTIYKFTPDGVQSTFGFTDGQSLGLAFDSAGNLFASDAIFQTIYKFTPDGTRSIFVDALAFDPNHAPTGLAFDRAGNLFASIEGQFPDAILKFEPDGTESTFATGLNSPRGLAFDSAGNLFVAEVGGGDILRFTPNGNMSVCASEVLAPRFLAFPRR